VETTFAYDLGRSLDEVRPGYRFDSSCQGTVPHALRAFLESTGVEDALRNAVSLGGGQRHPRRHRRRGRPGLLRRGPPPAIEAQVYALLDPGLAAVAQRFMARFGPGARP